MHQGFCGGIFRLSNAQVAPEKRLFLGRCDVLNADYSASKTTAYRTTLEEIKVNLIERIGAECSTAVELSQNMKSLDVKTDTSNIVTRLIPLGTQLDDETAERLTIMEINDGKPYIDDLQAIEKFGIIVGTVEFDDITLPENLLEKGRNFLEKNNKILKSYEAEILDLSPILSTHQSIECGNIYTFRNSFFGLDEPLRIMKKTTDIYRPFAPVVQIGDKEETATNLVKSGFNGHVVANESEICIMDTPEKSTARKVWRWNENGLGFSENGYNGTFGTAMTSDGAIVADFITAGVLQEKSA